MAETIHRINLGGRKVALAWVGQSRARPARVHALAFISSDEMLLVSDGPEDPHRWLPGGGVEEGETPEEALRRELLEEADAAVLALAYLGSQRLDDSQGRLEYLRYYWCRVALAPQERPRAEPSIRHIVPPAEFLDTLAWGRRDPAAPLLLDLARKAELRYRKEPERHG